jgi:hypothetical protein
MTSCSSSSRRPHALIVEDEVLIALRLEADLTSTSAVWLPLARSCGC